MSESFVQSTPESTFINTSHGLIKIDSEGKEWILNSQHFGGGQPSQYFWQALLSQTNDARQESKSVQ
jgi:hypothetical protein